MPRHEYVHELHVFAAPAPEDDSMRQPTPVDAEALALAELAEAGHMEVRAVITEGNLPSEAVFRKAGFRRV